MEDLLTIAARFINTTSSHIFLTGKAGTGKTTFLKNVSQVTHKRHIVVAPTGIAALNAGGVTIHSQFLLPPVAFLPDRFLPDDITVGGKFLNQNILAQKHPLNSARRQVLRSIDLLVIDEVSMLRADLLDAIDYRMRAARRNYRQSFGGAQVLFIGDLYQLPPVVKNEDQSILGRYYKSAWFYEAKALQQNPPVYIELERIFRQHDPLFIGILNNLRNSAATLEDIEMLNQHYMPAEEVSKLKEVITLTTHNYKADDLNQKELSRLTALPHVFDAFVEGDFPENMYPVLPQLELKEGAQIMFVRNDSEGKMYYNGKLATVKRIENDEVWVELTDSQDEYLLKRERWENKRYTVSDETRELEEEVVGSFEQFPIKLAWAITVHKSQGLTFDKAIIDVGQAFADGQVYVALSRLRSLDGLILRTRITPSVISTDPHVAAFAKANQQPGLLDEVMQSSQRNFLLQWLESTFDFTMLLKDIGYMKDDHASEILDEASMKPVLTQLAESLEAELKNTEAFRRQLSNLVLDGNTSLLLERLAKGQAYYRAFLVGNLKSLLAHYESMRQRKRVKEYLNHLRELDLMLTKKLEEVDQIYQLTTGILQGHNTFNFESLNQIRKEEREAMVNAIQRDLLAEKPSASGRKSRQKRKPKGSGGKTTHDISLDMFKAGMTVQQISNARGLVAGTIEGHLAKAVEAGLLNILVFVNEDELNEIVRACHQLEPGFSSKQLFDKLKGQYGYGKLKAVMAHLNRDNIS